MSGNDLRLAAARKRHWRRHRAAWSLAFALPLPLIFVAAWTSAVVWLVDLPVGLGAGLLTVPFWPEDRLTLWLGLARQRRWRDGVGGSLPRNRVEAERWLAHNSGRRDRWVISALLTAGRSDDAKQLLAELPPPTADEERFFRKLASANVDFNEGVAVDLDSLYSLASSIDDADARVMAQAQVANLGLGLVYRGDITRGEAVRRVKALVPQMGLPATQRLLLLLLHFSGLVVVLAVASLALLPSWVLLAVAALLLSGNWLYEVRRPGPANGVVLVGAFILALWFAVLALYRFIHP